MTIIGNNDEHTTLVLTFDGRVYGGGDRGREVLGPDTV